MPLSLGEVLGLHRRSKGLSLRDIQDRARSLQGLPRKLGRSAAYFSNLESGRAKVQLELLEHLASIYEIDGLLLMLNLPEPVSQVVHLDSKADFRHAPWQDPQTRGAEYAIARYRLADSDLVLVFLTLKPGGRSRPQHWHPGDEVVKVEKGDVVMVFPQQPQQVRERHLHKGQLIHFDSSFEHYVENRSAKLAELFIVRRFERRSGPAASSR